MQAFGYQLGQALCFFEDIKHHRSNIELGGEACGSKIQGHIGDRVLNLCGYDSIKGVLYEW